MHAAQGLGFSRGLAAGFVAAMIGFLLLQKIVNLHSHHLSAHDGLFTKRGEGDVIQTMTLTDVSISLQKPIARTF